MGQPDQENTGQKYCIGLGRDSTASSSEARKHHVYAARSHPRRQISKPVYMQDNRMYNVDPRGSSRVHYADSIALVKSNILDAVQQPTANQWVYDNNSLATGSLAFAAMGRPDCNNPGSRRQFLSFNSSREQRVVEKVHDAYQIMHARSHGNCVMNSTALNCNLPVSHVPDPSGSAMKVFPFVAPVLQEQASTARVHQISTTSSQPLTGGGPSTRMLLSDSGIKPCSTQLTIFYAGKVNVYNEVSSIKAQEIMLMAASGNSLPLNIDMLSGTSNQMVSSPAPRSLKNGDPAQTSQMDPSACQNDQFARDQGGIGPLPATSQAPQAEEKTMPGTQSTYLDDEPVFPRALPQARKASLARFLERRKERVLLKSPYPELKTFL